MCTMALNAKLENDGGTERQTEQSFWMPKLRKMMTQNAWMGMKDGSERQTKRKNVVVAANVKYNSGSERQN